MKLKLNTLSIKIIALITMFIDHLSHALYVSGTINGVTYYMGKSIGRFAFPIYAYLLLVGFHKTHDRKMYALRLFLFALISELPFDYLHSGKWIDWSYQNVFFELLAMFFVFVCFNKTDELSWKKPLKILVKLCVVIGVGFWSVILGFDYGWFGIAIGTVFYIAYQYRANKTKFGFIVLLGFILALSVYMFIYPLELLILWVIPLLLMCNTDKKVLQPKVMKIGFYAFYPLHLLILGLIFR